MNYIDRIISNCEAAKKQKPIREFILNQNDLSELNGINMAIYIIEQVSGNPEKTFNTLKEYKATKDRACPALNQPSHVMYVGSSTTGLKNRIKQHIGSGAKQTYSLHLSEWFHDDYMITIKEYYCSREIIQIIEDELSDRLKPAFGKQGGNNK